VVFGGTLMVTYFIKPRRRRPDCRLLLSFLWPDSQNVDAWGDISAASGYWTDLDCFHILRPEEEFSVYPVKFNPLILCVESETEEMASRVTYFLSKQTRCGFFETQFGWYRQPESLISRFGWDFDLDEAWGRIKKSPWYSQGRGRFDSVSRSAESVRYDARRN
jgi:hypothetical protein